MTLQHRALPFIVHASEKSLQQWMQHHPPLSFMTKLDIAIAMTHAVKRLHDNHIFNCYVTPDQIKVDLEKPLSDAVTVTNDRQVLNGHEQNEARQTDIYDLGVTLGLWLNLLVYSQVKPDSSSDEDMFADHNDQPVLLEAAPENSEVSHSLLFDLRRMIAAMRHNDMAERMELNDVYEGLMKMRNRITYMDSPSRVYMQEMEVLHASSSPVDLTAQVMREEDLLLVFGDNPEADLYSWSEWFSWLCNNLRADFRNIAGSTLESSRHIVGLCGFFNSPRSQVPTHREPAPLTEVVVQNDSDDESVEDGRMMRQGRY